jgi:hypothetical protein
MAFLCVAQQGGVQSSKTPQNRFGKGKKNCPEFFSPLPDFLFLLYFFVVVAFSGVPCSLEEPKKGFKNAIKQNRGKFPAAAKTKADVSY